MISKLKLTNLHVSALQNWPLAFPSLGPNLFLVKTFVETFNKKLSIVFGIAGRAVACNTGGSRFESSHRQNLYWTFVSCQLYWKDENKEKRGREWPIFNNCLKSKNAKRKKLVVRTTVVWRKVCSAVIDFDFVIFLYKMCARRWLFCISFHCT